MKKQLFQLNTWICIDLLKITDLGGAIIVHTFACIFGLAVARCLFKSARKNHKLEESNYVSDTFALIGTGHAYTILTESIRSCLILIVKVSDEKESSKNHKL